MDYVFGFDEVSAYDTHCCLGKRLGIEDTCMAKYAAILLSLQQEK